MRTSTSLGGAALLLAATLTGGLAGQAFAGSEPGDGYEITPAGDLGGLVQAGDPNAPVLPAMNAPITACAELGALVFPTDRSAAAELAAICTDRG